MIRIEIGRGKSVVEADGKLVVILSEMTYAIKEIYDAIKGEIGEESTKKRIKRMAELAVMDEKDLEKNTQKILEEKPELYGFANFIHNQFMR